MLDVIVARGQRDGRAGASKYEETNRVHAVIRSNRSRASKLTNATTSHTTSRVETGRCGINANAVNMTPAIFPSVLTPYTIPEALPGGMPRVARNWTHWGPNVDSA